jgi:hypothetical protein
MMPPGLAEALSYNIDAGAASIFRAEKWAAWTSAT